MTTSPASTDSAKTSCCCAYPSWLPPGATLGFLLLRLWLAVRAIVTCVEKFAETKLVAKPLADNPDMIVQVQQKVYSITTYHGIPPSMRASFLNEPLIANWILTPYGYILGLLLAVTGVTLLLGIYTRATLFVMGLVYVSLTFGMILLGQDSGIAWLATHMVMIALALRWCDQHNKYTLTNC
jgi:thiosulfate dehydrogenase [quinone] large subunit